MSKFTLPSSVPSPLAYVLALCLLAALGANLIALTSALPGLGGKPCAVGVDPNGNCIRAVPR